MKHIFYNAPILAGDTWYNADGSCEPVRDYGYEHFKASDYAKAVALNNKIIAALFCAAAIVAIAYKVF